MEKNGHINRYDESIKARKSNFPLKEGNDKYSKLYRYLDDINSITLSRGGKEYPRIYIIENKYPIVYIGVDDRRIDRYSDLDTDVIDKLVFKFE